MTEKEFYKQQAGNEQVIFMDDEDIQSYINELKYGDIRAKIIAERALVAAGSEAIRPLASLLRDCKKETKFYIINILGNIGGVDVLAPLSWVALGDKSCFNRKLAVLALGDSRTEKAFPCIIKCIEDENEQVRMAVGNALSRLGLKQALPILESALEIEQSEIVQNRYMETIAKIKANGMDNETQNPPKLLDLEALGKEFGEHIGKKKCLPTQKYEPQETEKKPAARRSRKITGLQIQKTAAPNPENNNSGIHPDADPKEDPKNQESVNEYKSMVRKINTQIRLMESSRNEAEAALETLRKNYRTYIMQKKQSELKTLCVKR